eukprot:gene5357-7431_t
MKFALHPSVHREISALAKEVNGTVRKLFEKANADEDLLQAHLSFAFYLSTVFDRNKYDEFEEMVNWMSVLEKMDDMLNSYSLMVPTCEEPSKNWNDNFKFILTSILVFLTNLFKIAKDKRYFLSYEPINRLLKAFDLEIVELAMELLFAVCLHSPSSVLNINEDYNDTVEIPDSTADVISAIFSGLSMISTEFGISEYIKGQDATFADMETSSVTLHFPTTAVESESVVSILISVTSDKTKSIQELFTNDTKIIENSLTSKQKSTVLGIRRLFYGINDDIQFRLRLTIIRLQAFFIIMHSKQLLLIQDYVRGGAIFLKELIEISDGSSEVVSELGLLNPTKLSATALQCTLSLLENKLRRRGILLLDSNIIRGLGLLTLTSQDVTWTAIVSTSCSSAMSFINDINNKSSVYNGNANNSQSNNKVSDNIKYLILNKESIISGLELFTLCVSIKESSEINTDMPLMGTIISLLQSSLPFISNILKDKQMNEQSNELSHEDTAKSVYEQQIMLIVSKALYCLDVCLSKSGYLSVFRESDGFSPISKIIEIFANDGCNSRNIYTLNYVSRCVLKNAISVLYLAIVKSRQTIILQGNNTDTGLNVVYQPYFNKLCYQMFQSSYEKNDDIWVELISMVKDVIDLDPPYLSHFLSSTFADQLKLVLSHLFPDVFSGTYCDLDILLLPLLKLGNVVCITAEGRAFLAKSNIINFVIESSVHSSSILPKSYGISNDRLTKIGKVLTQILVDCDSMKIPTKQLIKSKLLGYAKEAKVIWDGVTMSEQPDLQSPRYQVLQKLGNICVILESFLNEHRRLAGDFLRDILSETTIEALVSSYQCSFPPSQQLFAQVSIRSNNTTAPHFGHYSSAKAISSLLKLAASTMPQVVIGVLYKEIDNTLSGLSGYKLALKSLHSSNKSNGSSGAQDYIKDSLQVSKSTESIPSLLNSGKARRSRSRGSSLGQIGANVLMLGVLDAIPHITLIDPSFEVEMSNHGGDVEIYVWKLLLSVLTIEWLSLMLSHTLRSITKVPTANSSISAGKDILRRLFAYHRSSMLEVCRFASSNWKEQPMTNCRSKKGLMDSFATYDSSSDEKNMYRKPSEYLLRVGISSGALFREGIDIEGSRVVFVADVGTTIVATERRINQGGVIRYLTAHGWLSEFRRDNHQSPIVELIGVSGIASELSQQKNGKESDGELLEILTLREATSFSLTRSHSAMKHVVGYLSKTLVAIEGSSSSSRAQSVTALSLSLGQMFKGFFTDSFNCLEGSEMATGILHQIQELKSIEVNDERDVVTPTIPSNLVMSPTLKNTPPKSVQKTKKGNRSETFSSLTTSVSFSDLTKQTVGISVVNSDEDEVPQESVQVNVSALCLYYGALAKYVMLPILEDRNGNLYVSVLRTFSNLGILNLFCDALVFVLMTLRKSTENATAVFKTGLTSTTEWVLDGPGRCALHSLPSMLGLLRRLVCRDQFSKSISTSQGSSLILTDENGPYQSHDLLFNILKTVSGSVIRIHKANTLINFPADIQLEWISIISELIHNLITPMPAPKEFPLVAAGLAKGGYELHPISSSDRNGSREYFSFGRSSADRPVPRPSSSAVPSPPIPRVEQPFVPNEAVVNSIGEMGFSRVHVLSAMTALRSNNVESVMDYVFSHPFSMTNVQVTANQTGPSASFNVAETTAVNVAPSDITAQSNEQDRATGVLDANQPVFSYEGFGEDEDPDLLLAMQMSMASMTEPEASLSLPSEVRNESEVIPADTPPMRATDSIASPLIASNPSLESTAIDALPNLVAELELSNAHNVTVSESESLRSTAIDALPNLVADLELSNAHNATVSESESASMEIRPSSIGLRPQFVDASFDLPTTSMSSDVNSQAATPPISSFRHVMDQLFSNHSLGNSSDNSLPNPPLAFPSGRREHLDMLAQHLGYSNLNPNNLEPGTRESFPPIPPTNPNTAKEKDSVDSQSKLRSELFNTQSNKVKAMADILCSFILENVLKLCGSYDSILRWGLVDSTNYLMHHLCEFVIKFQEESKQFKYAQFLSDILQLIKLQSAEYHPSKENKLYGFLYFLTVFIKNSVVKKETEKLLTRNFAIQLMNSLLRVLHLTAMEKSLDSWPNWVSPAFVLIYELLQMPTPALENDQSIPFTKKPFDSIIEEKEEGVDLNEHKDSKEDNLDESKIEIKRNESKDFFPVISTSIFENVMLVPNSLSSSLLDLIMVVIESEKYLIAETYQGLMLVIWTLLKEQDLATVFVKSHGVKKILELKCNIDFEEGTSNLLSLVIQRCLETNAELQYGMIHSICTRFKLLAKENSFVPFDQFVHYFAEHLTRSPADFWQACSNCVKLIKVLKPVVMPPSQKLNETNGGDADTVISDKKFDNKLTNEEKLNNTAPPQFDIIVKLKSGLHANFTQIDNRATSTLHDLTQFIIYQLNMKNGSEVNFNTNSITLSRLPSRLQDDDNKKLIHSLCTVLDTLSDSILSLKRIPALFSKLIKTDMVQLKRDGGDKLLDVLIRTVYSNNITRNSAAPPTTDELKIERKTLMERWSVSRLLVALCAFKAPSRYLALNSIMKVIRNPVHTVQKLIVHTDSRDGVNKDLNQKENKRISIITKMAALLSVIVRSSKASPLDAEQSKTHYGVSVDSIYYLVEHGRILKTLVNSLLRIPIHSSGAGKAFAAILELIELVTRPKLQAYLDKFSVSNKNSTITAKNISSGVSTSVKSDLDNVSACSVEMSVGEMTDEFVDVQPTFTGGNSEIRIAISNDNVDALLMEISQQHDHGAVEAYLDSHQNHGKDFLSDGGDWRAHDAILDNPHDLLNNRFLPNFVFNSYDEDPQINDDSFVNIENWLSPSSNLVSDEARMSRFSRFNISHGNTFVTPPQGQSNTIGVDEFNILSNVDPDPLDNSLEMIVDMIRRARSSAGGTASNWIEEASNAINGGVSVSANIRDPHTIHRPTGSSTSLNDRISTDLILPHGINQALSVSQPVINHPILQRSFLPVNTNPYFNNGLALPPFPPLIRQTEIDNPNRLISSSGFSPFAPMYAPPADLLQSAGRTLREGVPVMPAMWPGVAGRGDSILFDSSNRPNTRRTNPTQTPISYSNETTFQNMRRILQNYVSEGVELLPNEVEEPPSQNLTDAFVQQAVDEGSIQSSQFISAISAQSYDVQEQETIMRSEDNTDVNVNSRVARSSPIPPLIVISERDQANEEMSVLTAPQEEGSLMTDNYDLDSANAFTMNSATNEFDNMSLHRIDERNDDDEFSIASPISGMHGDHHDDSADSATGAGDSEAIPMERFNAIDQVIDQSNDLVSTCMSALSFSVANNNNSENDSIGSSTIQSNVVTQAVVYEDHSNSVDNNNNDESVNRDQTFNSLEELFLSQGIHQARNFVDGSSASSITEPGTNFNNDGSSAIDEIEPTFTAEPVPAEVNPPPSSSSGLECPVGYDVEVFNSLPEDMQREIIEQHGETAQQMRSLAEAAGFDYDTIVALPESIRQEILEQARRDQAAANGSALTDPTQAQEMDNASFLASLTPELRQDVLISADAEFLAGLPAELVAEAQVYRERHASRWQSRELVGGERSVPSQPTRVSTGAGIASSGEQGGDGDGDDDDEDNEDWENSYDAHEDPRLQNRHANDLNRNKSSKQKPIRTKTGLMKIPFIDNYKTKIPSSLSVLVAKLAIEPITDGPSTTLLQQIITNISTKIEIKENSLKLFISIILEESDMLNTVIHDISNNELDIQFLISNSRSLTNTSNDSSKILIEKSTKNIHSNNKQQLQLSTKATQNLLHILTSMMVANPIYIYLSLLSRNKSGNLITEISELQTQLSRITYQENELPLLLPLSTGLVENGSEITSNEMEFKKNNNKSDKLSIITQTQDTACNTFLEMVVGLLSKPTFNSSELLEMLMKLIDVMTSPLENLIDESPIISSPTNTVVKFNDIVELKSSTTVENELIVDEKQKELHSSEHNSKDASKANSKLIQIPRVELNRESLTYLCEVLISDICSQNVFVFVTSTISRLAKVSKNSVILLGLIYDVIIDLASQSQSKLDNLLSSLVGIRSTYHNSLANTVTNPHEKSNVNIINLKMPSDVNVSSENQPVEIPTSLLPLGEAGSKYHERLLRVVETLQLMAEKTNRQLLDVLPIEQLMPCWTSLEAVLNQLKAYLVYNDEDLEKMGSTSNIRPQSTLTSTLNRLLPAIEAFFLIYTHDILSDKNTVGMMHEKKKMSLASESVELKDDRSKSMNEKLNDSTASNNNTPMVPDSAALVIPVQQMPGHNYRTTPSYIRSNISLFNNESSSNPLFLMSLSTMSLEDKIPLVSSRSQNKSNLTSKTQRLISFVQANKGILNLIIKSRPNILESSFASLIRITQLRPFIIFENKRKYFFTQLKKAISQQSSHNSRRGIHLQIRRNQIFEDTFHQLRVRTADELRGRLQVNFFGEEGVDAGGLTREWYSILSREIFNPNYALFTIAADGVTFQPNPLSMINTNHLDYFKFVGRVIGKAICDGQLMDAHFTRSFYKHVLGMSVEFTDIEATEPDYYKTLKQILETPLDLLMMDLTFSAEIHKFGKLEVVDLIPNGRNLLVTDENKGEYIKLIAHHRMTSAIREQIDSFLSGLYDLIPPELISIFTPIELELLICGLPDINVDELYVHTDYHMYKASDDVILWFWEVLRGFNRTERASFLQFVTGTSKVPLGGFANLQGMRGNQRFSVHKAYGAEAGLLPTAHTCFNQLDLPSYKSAAELKEKLLTAINEGSEGFGFA